ncbi:MAG: DUF5615 family PIN-like protein [Bryobacteraceae bacterium]
MKIRFQADNDLRKAIVRGVARRAPEIDFRSAQLARLDGVTDSEVLAMAAREDRILVSHDFQTMPGHFREFIKMQHSPGVLLISQDLAIGIAVESLLTMWGASNHDEWQNRLCLIPSLVAIAIGVR